MIILSKVPAEQDDQASIHTLVEPTNSPSNDNLRIRRLLTPLIFASLGFSSATFAFAVYNFSLSTLHTIPIFVAFTLSIPVHVGIIFILWRPSSHPEPPELPTSIMGTKASRVTYVIVVQIAWLVAAVVCPMVLTNRWEMTEGFCKAKTETDLCEGRAQVTFSVITAFTFIEVTIQGLIARFLLKWDPSLARETGRSDGEDRLEGHHWKISLTFASLIFTTLPVIVALLYIKNSQTLLFSIPTLLAFILITPFHVNVMLCWWLSSKNPIPFEPLVSAQCIAYIVLTGIFWLSSAATSILFVSNTGMLNGICQNVSSPLKCQGQAQVCFMLSAVSTCFQVLILGAMITKATVTRYGRRCVEGQSGLFA